MKKQGNRMKRLAKFVENDGGKENIIKRAAKTLGFHTKFDGGIGLVKIERNMTDNC